MLVLCVETAGGVCAQTQGLLQVIDRQTFVNYAETLVDFSGQELFDVIQQVTCAKKYKTSLHRQHFREFCQALVANAAGPDKQQFAFKTETVETLEQDMASLLPILDCADEDVNLRSLMNVLRALCPGFPENAEAPIKVPDSAGTFLKLLSSTKGIAFVQVAKTTMLSRQCELDSAQAITEVRQALEKVEAKSSLMPSDHDQMTKIKHSLAEVKVICKRDANSKKKLGELEGRFTGVLRGHLVKGVAGLIDLTLEQHLRALDAPEQMKHWQFVANLDYSCYNDLCSGTLKPVLRKVLHMHNVATALAQFLEWATLHQMSKDAPLESKDLDAWSGLGKTLSPMAADGVKQAQLQEFEESVLTPFRSFCDKRAASATTVCLQELRTLSAGTQRDDIAAMEEQAGKVKAALTACRLPKDDVVQLNLVPDMVLYSVRSQQVLQSDEKHMQVFQALHIVNHVL